MQFHPHAGPGERADRNAGPDPGRGRRTSPPALCPRGHPGRPAEAIFPDRPRRVLTRHHAPYYQEIVSGAPASSFLIQPENRGTATAVLYALLGDARRRPWGPVVILPSDHWVSDDAAFMAHIARAQAAVEARP